MGQETTRRPGYLVKRVQQAFRQASDELLRPIGLSMAQYAVLVALAENPGASSAELARQCFVTRQSLRDVLTGLKTAGLVAVAEVAPTGRARPVRLTASGEARLSEAHRAVGEVEERMLAGMSEPERRRLAGLLSTCAENLTPADR
ncbi:MarR family winged helix-turn-helix transcriptional regulator [Amycolatopsis echigonensis]|uniref:MarR family transcriptional regulator n=1 Tax=Amycolatopsis echigonensis TaxID=2576905 RepID=A0A2N3WBS2_9PSEU|nr:MULTISPECIES: MarR family transcriptional regulator [Amycolatopsis]MBB2502905.1 MarR family transcriptional regulator [Amycolatopsis echigonensis]PKV91287.1 MarR family transcriptional regulator [Amycolatopsis niigatensis]